MLSGKKPLPNLNDSHIIPAMMYPQRGSKQWKLQLPATGWLLGIAVNPQGYTELNCYLEDWGSRIPDSNFMVGMAMTSGGIVFKEPIENKSTANPFFLVANKMDYEGAPDIPNCVVYPIGCWDK